MTSETAADRAYRALRSEIIEGMLAPGSALAEVEQAARLGVSRTPVREAFARLLADGLVEQRGPRTLLVSSIDADDVRALFDLRSALDEQAARLAARRGEPEAFAALAARLDSAADLLARDDDARSAYYALVAEFDAAIDQALRGRSDGEGTDSPYLRSALQRLRVHLERVRRLAHDDDERLVRAAAEHAAIARAIADRDPERAVAATRVHLHEAQQSIHRHLKASSA